MRLKIDSKSNFQKFISKLKPWGFKKQKNEELIKQLKKEENQQPKKSTSKQFSSRIKSPDQKVYGLRKANLARELALKKVEEEEQECTF